VRSGAAQQSWAVQSTGHFEEVRLPRQAGLSAFLVLPMGVWLWRRHAWAAAGVQLLPMALLFGAAMLLVRDVAAPAILHLAWNSRADEEWLEKQENRSLIRHAIGQRGEREYNRDGVDKP
jgi:hypothetical protein